MVEGRQRGRLRHRRQVVGQTHETHRVADLARGGHVTDARAGERERLAHRAADDQARVIGEQLEGARRARARELDVRLVDDDDGVRRRVVDGAHDVVAHRGARRVVRRADEHDVRTVLAHLLDCEVDVEVVDALTTIAQAVDPCRSRAARDDRVHRVARREAERDAARATEGLHDVAEHLVAAVGGPDLLDRQPDARHAIEVVGEGRAQFGELAVRVAVQPARGLLDSLDDAAHDRLRHVVGRLVRVERDGHVELRRAVRALASQVFAQQLRDRGFAHAGAFSVPASASSRRSKRAVTASPCAGRSSAFASVTTTSATSARASRE